MRGLQTFQSVAADVDVDAGVSVDVDVGVYAHIHVHTYIYIYTNMYVCMCVLVPSLLSVCASFCYIGHLRLLKTNDEIVGLSSSAIACRAFRERRWESLHGSRMIRLFPIAGNIPMLQRGACEFCWLHLWSVIRI